MRQVVFLNGPIGAGKTALGRALATALGAAFIDSDDLRDPSKRWFEESLSLANAVAHAGMAALAGRPVLVIAMPLRAREWTFFRARFGAEEIATYCITLAAGFDTVLDPKRGRAFDSGERMRIKEMIEQGYAARSFSDLILATDHEGFAETLAELTASCRRLLTARCAS
jgi:hypothetical protein